MNNKNIKIHASLDPMLGVSAVMKFQREYAKDKGLGINQGVIFTYKLINGEEVGVHVYQTKTTIVARRTYREGESRGNPE